MTDEQADGDGRDQPVGYIEGHGPGNPSHEPQGAIGARDHGPTNQGARGPRRSLTSSVWGGFAAAVTTEHAEDVRPWNPDCSWYAYGRELCLNGCQHPGMDIGVVRGTALYAAADGTVKFAGWADFFRPYHVVVRTPGGEEHIYAHMWSIDPGVVQGGQVRAGQYLGTSGEQTRRGTMTPDGSGAHLHFERRGSNGCAVDPEEILVGIAVTPSRCAPEAPPPYDGERKRINDVVFHPDKQTVRSAIEGLAGRRWASRSACQTDEPVEKGTKIDVLYWVKGEEVDGEDRWWVTPSGSRISASETVEKPRRR